MQDTTLSHATMQGSVFTGPFDAILAVSMSRTGAYWAAATRNGEIWVWEEGGLTLRHELGALTRRWSGRSRSAQMNARSPARARTAASSCGRSAVVRCSGRVGLPKDLADSPFLLMEVCLLVEGLMRSFGSGMLSAAIPLRALPHTSPVFSLTWSPDGRLLASGCSDGSIWVWQPEAPEPETRVQVFAAHTDRVMGLAFSPDGTQLASASYDGTVKLWNLTHASLPPDVLGAYGPGAERGMESQMDIYLPAVALLPPSGSGTSSRVEQAECSRDIPMR